MKKTLYFCLFKQQKVYLRTPKNTTMNIIAILVAALIHMLLGFVWYHPKVMGTLWMKETGLTEEKMKGGNMFLIFGLSLLFAFMLSFFMSNVVIHQAGVGSALYYALKDPTRAVAAQSIVDQFVGDGIYAHEGRTIHHGVLHGVIAGFFFMLPLFATNAMFERKSFKYIFVNAGYWIICLGIMGGIMSAWQ